MGICFWCISHKEMNFLDLHQPISRYMYIRNNWHSTHFDLPNTLLFLAIARPISIIIISLHFYINLQCQNLRQPSMKHTYNFCFQVKSQSFKKRRGPFSNHITLSLQLLPTIPILLLCNNKHFTPILCRLINFTKIFIHFKHMAYLYST